MLENEIKKNQSKRNLQGWKNTTIIKNIRFDRKKTKEWWNCQK
jgi:hypothetical protein